MDQGFGRGLAHLHRPGVQAARAARAGDDGGVVALAVDEDGDGLARFGVGGAADGGRRGDRVAQGVVAGVKAAFGGVEDIVGTRNSRDGDCGRDCVDSERFVGGHCGCASGVADVGREGVAVIGQAGHGGRRHVGAECAVGLDGGVIGLADTARAGQRDGHALAGFGAGGARQGHVALLFGGVDDVVAGDGAQREGGRGGGELEAARLCRADVAGFVAHGGGGGPAAVQPGACRLQVGLRHGLGDGTGGDLRVGEFGVKGDDAAIGVGDHGGDHVARCGVGRQRNDEFDAVGRFGGIDAFGGVGDVQARQRATPDGVEREAAVGGRAGQASDGRGVGGADGIEAVGGELV